MRTGLASKIVTYTRRQWIQHLAGAR